MREFLYLCGGVREIRSQFKTVIFDDFYWQFLNVYDFGMKIYISEAITEITTEDTTNDIYLFTAFRWTHDEARK